MDSKKNISFCTTSFNSGDRLYYSLKSILINMSDNDEMICVDNYSDYETMKSYERIINEFNDKNIFLVQLKCNRGYGFDYAHRLASGKTQITFGSDVIFNENLFKVIDLWLKSSLSNKKVLHLHHCYIFPKKIYKLIGGYKHINASEDTDIMNRLMHKNMARFCLIKVGDNWDMKIHPEKRFVKSSIKIFWRTLLHWKDYIMVRPNKYYMVHISKAKKFSGGGISFYLFWIPLITFLYIYYYPFLNKLMLLTDKEKLFIDFKGIKGERYNG